VSTDTVSEIAAGLQQDADMLASMYDLPSEEGGNGNEADQGDQGGTQKPVVDAAADGGSPAGEGGDPAAAPAGDGDPSGAAPRADDDPKAGAIPLNRHKAILSEKQQALDQAQTQIQTLQTELDALRQQAPSAQRTADIDAAKQKLTEKLAWVKENMPEAVAEVLEAQQALLEQSREEARQSREEARQLRERHEADARTSQQARTQAVIDQVPDLKAREGKRALFNAALDVDREFRESGEWDGKDPVERLRAVVARVKEDLGLPTPQTQKPDGGAAATPQKPAPAQQPAAPTTLSSLPSGRAPNDDAAQDIDAMDQLEAFHALQSLPAHKQEEWLLRSM
jgi:hypothetical protein